MEIILSFFTVFMFEIKKIFILNIVWILFFIYSLIKNKGKFFIEQYYKIYLYFFIWGLFSIFLYNLFFYKFTLRQILSLIFSIQYLFLAMQFNLNKNKFFNWIIKWDVLLSFYIFYKFIINGYYKSFSYWSGMIRTWGREIPGFPTMIILPMCFAVFLTFYCKKSIHLSIFLSISTFLIPSRLGQVGILIIWLYYLLKKKKNYKIIAIWIILSILIYLLFMKELNILLSRLLYRYRAGSNADRYDICFVVYQYFKGSPIIGYGGNTLDTLVNLIGNYSRFNIIWPHTHNFILEFLIRYGIVGVLIFCIYFLKVVKKIAKNTDYMFFIILLLFFAMVQTYMQNFVYIFIYMSIICFKEDKKIGENDV